MRTLADSQPVLTGSSGTNGGARYVSTQAADLAPGESEKGEPEDSWEEVSHPWKIHIWNSELTTFTK